MNENGNEASVSVPPDPLDQIVAAAEEYARKEATEAVQRATDSASSTRFATVWNQTYLRYYRAAYYDHYFQLLRDSQPSEARPP